MLKGRRDARCHWSDPAVSADLWEYYLPYLYSCISLFGVLLLLCELWDISQRCPSPGGPSCAGCGSPGVPGWEQRLFPANGAGVRRGCGAGLSTHPLTRTLVGVWGGLEYQDTPCSAFPPTAVCTPFGLSTMFTVTGKLLVKPRVRCRPPRVPLPQPGGLRSLGLPGLPSRARGAIHGCSRVPRPSPAPRRPG